MRHWTLVRSVSELNSFLKDFRACTEDERQAILAEMLIHIAEYQESITINGEEQRNLKMPRQVETSSFLKSAKRAGRRRRGFNG